MRDDMHHVELHKHTLFAERLASWIFSDVYFNCDGEAFQRTNFRVTAVFEQHGPMGLYGLAVNWSMLGLAALTEEYGSTPSVIAMLGEDFDASELEVDERGKLTAAQFIQAVGNDDLEMAEVLFSVANQSSIEDTGAFLNAILGITLHLLQLVE